MDNSDIGENKLQVQSNEAGHVAKTLSRVIPTNEFLTTYELMALLKVKDKKTIYRFIERGMPVVRVGRHYRFIKEDVVTFLRRNAD